MGFAVPSFFLLLFIELFFSPCILGTILLVATWTVRGSEGRIEKKEKLRTVGELKDKKRGTMKR